MDLLLFFLRDPHLILKFASLIFTSSKAQKAQRQNRGAACGGPVHRERGRDVDKDEERGDRRQAVSRRAMGSSRRRGEGPRDRGEEEEKG